MIEMLCSLSETVFETKSISVSEETFSFESETYSSSITAVILYLPGRPTEKVPSYLPVAELNCNPENSTLRVCASVSPVIFNPIRLSKLPSGDSALPSTMRFAVTDMLPSFGLPVIFAASTETEYSSVISISL